jgi:arginase
VACHTCCVAATFLIVPQWQGSGSSRAMRLIDGAEAIRGDLPAASTLVVDVPTGAGSSLDSAVHRLSALEFVRTELAATLHDVTTTPITIGGDCGVDLAAIEHVSRDGDVAVLWLDAHPDLNTPDSSPSGAFCGMVLRTLLGEGPDALLPARPLTPDRVVLAGVRAEDDAETEYVAARGIRTIAPDALDAESVAAALTATGASSVYIHIDLDVLDPSEFACVGTPEPFGITMATLLAVIGAARDALPLAGASLVEFAPGSPEDALDDLPTILRIIGALTRER